MKRFNFALEKVLGYRKQLEMERRRALAMAVEVFRRREDDLNAVTAEVMSYRTKLAEMGTGRLSTRELALYRSYLTHLEMQMTHASQWLHDARTAVEGRREELVVASKESKVMEKLKTRDRARYDYAANREESHELDEIGTTGHYAGLAAAGQEETV
jgi:flagellar export protein FliJ